MDDILEILTYDARITIQILCVPVSFAALCYQIWVMVITQLPHDRLIDRLDRMIYLERLKHGPVSSFPDYTGMLLAEAKKDTEQHGPELNGVAAAVKTSEPETKAEPTIPQEGRMDHGEPELIS